MLFRYLCLFALWLLSSSAAFAEVRRVAVLQFQGVGMEREVLLKLSDQSRLAALEVLPASEYEIMTRENMQQILSDMGKDISECVGVCEIEVGRNLGVDWIVTGDILTVDGVYHLTLKLHETKGGKLIAGRDIEARGFSDLKDETFEESLDLFEDSLETASIVSSARSAQIIKKLGYKAVLIPAGTFTMGCTKEQEDCEDNEKPTHRVTISRVFLMMESEVTQALYEQVMEESPSKIDGLSRPVEQVSWVEAAQFANKLSEKEGLESCYTIFGTLVKWSNKDCNGWRLPTEAEWEWAARGGQRYLYAGSDSLDDVGWFDEDESADVCSLQKNGFDLCDLSGNVSEWVWDWYRDYSTSSEVDPAGKRKLFWGKRLWESWTFPLVNHKVVRGGSYYEVRGYRTSYLRNYRVSDRQKIKKNTRSEYIGFRLVRNP